jgi:hypothetical protein
LAVSTERTFAYVHNYVALFDFVTPSEQEAIRQWENAWTFLRASDILVRLDRRRLRSEIIPNHLGRNDATACGCIPYLEVWYPDEIPTRFITAIYVMPLSSHLGDFAPIPTTSTDAVHLAEKVRTHKPDCPNLKWVLQFVQQLRDAKPGPSGPERIKERMRRLLEQGIAAKKTDAAGGTGRPASGDAAET